MGRHGALALMVLVPWLLAYAVASDMATSGIHPGSAPTVLPPASDLDAKTAKDAPPSNAEKFTFQAEVNRLMDIIINSLYSNRDIFLRELISNASDALDKIRFLTLVRKTGTDGSSAEATGDSNEEDKLEIRVSFDKGAGTLHILDTGVGMSRDELIKNLGTIAKSGTSSFLDRLSDASKDAAQKLDKNGASNLIGQFGVGFYSAYLVADKVRVESRVEDEQVNVWESGAEENFVIYTGKDESFPGRGTRITLFLKEDAKEYLDQEKLKELIQKFSQFISFPIYLRTTEDVQVPDDSAEEKQQEDDGSAGEKTDDESSADDDSDDDIAVNDDDGKSKKDPDSKHEKPKTRTETRLSWTQMNENKPIWTRDPADLTDEDYNKFYEGIAKMPGKPLAHTHFKGEGEVEFRSILYIPDKPPVGLYGGSAENEKDAIRLYVRRVLVTDKFEEGLLPRYLGFLLGIVDSDDLPINVSREMLQKSKTLDIIKRKLIRKALEMVRSIVKDEETAIEKEKEGNDDKTDKDDDNEESEASKDSKDGKLDKTVRPYVKFWKEYGKMIKLGVIEDSANRARLAKLLRFRTSKSNMDDPNDWSSLDQYLDRMKSDQENIYYHSGENAKAIASSPFLEKLLKKDYEVIYLTEPIDEHMITHLTDFEGSKFMSAAKDNFKFGEKDQKEERSKANALKITYKPLTKFLKKRLGDKVSKVKLSTRLSNTPCVLSNEQWGYSARMEIIMKAQAFADPDSFEYMVPKAKIMELNPNHPIIKKLLDMVNEASDKKADDLEKAEAKIMELGHLVYDTALISSGYLMQDNSEFAGRMYKLLATSIDVDPNAVIEDAVPVEDSAASQESKEDFDAGDLDTEDLLSKAAGSKVDDNGPSSASLDLDKDSEHGTDEHDEL